MDDARDFTADLLAGRRTYFDDRLPRGPGNDPRTADELFLDVHQALDTLDALRVTDPAEALQTFRELLGNGSLTEDDLASFIEVWRTAIDNPEKFRNEVSSQERGIGDWWDHLRAYLHRPAGPNDQEKKILDQMKASYVLPNHPLAPPMNPHERVFEILDPAWVPLLNVKLGERRWPQGLVTMPRHRSRQEYVYPAIAPDGSQLATEAPHTVALFSDFGTGYYHSWGIAQQLTAWAFPYSFHLGDVYYAGRPDEFTRRFELPLFEVVEKTRLLGLPENHELYSGGAPYLEYFEKLRARGRTPQEGSYFCVRFPHHQIIGIDVNWQSRQRYQDPELRAWLAARLAEAGDRTNILLSGSAPFDHGEIKGRPLLQDLSEFVATGTIGLWFWGDDHYCALFDRRPEVPFYGSCIGHGGFPGTRQREWRATYKTSPLWVEDLARFPAATHLRDDMSNNGWCQATLRPDGGVDLLYVDWLWCKRAVVSFTRDGAGLRAGGVTVIDRDTNPQIHRP